MNYFPDGQAPDPAEVKRITGQVVAEIERERREQGAPSDPLTWPRTSVARFLKAPPPSQEYVLEDLLPRGVVGGIMAAGGVGKSFLLLQIAFALATATTFGPFRPTGKIKTLYVAGEDPEWELHRRAYLIADQMGLSGSPGLSENLAPVSTVGQIGPLIALDENSNPATTPAYDWLRSSIEALAGLEVLILDPMSRFYGLNENDNSHATAWIFALERLAQAHGLTVLFAHHEPKSARTMELRDSAGRGASALRDGCRWTAALRWMTDKDAERYEVNPRDFVEFDVPKANYSPLLPASTYFRRGPGGVLEPAYLVADRLRSMAETLCRLLLQADQELTRRDLVKGLVGKAIAQEMSAQMPGFTRSRDMVQVVDFALQEGMATEARASAGTKDKRVIRPMVVSS